MLVRHLKDLLEDMPDDAIMRYEGINWDGWYSEAYVLKQGAIVHIGPLHVGEKAL